MERRRDDEQRAKRRRREENEINTIRENPRSRSINKTRTREESKPERRPQKAREKSPVRTVQNTNQKAPVRKARNANEKTSLRNTQISSNRVSIQRNAQRQPETLRNRPNHVRRRKPASRIAKISNKTIFTFFFTFIVITTLTVCAFVFFNIDNIKVNSTQYYTEQEIIKTANIEIGDNLLFLDTSAVEKKLLETYPYIESVKVKKIIPTGIEMNFVYAKEYFSVLADGQYYTLTRYGKILSSSAFLNESTTLLSIGETVKKDGCLELASKKENEVLKDLMIALADVAEGKITEINMTNIDQISLIYDGRIEMKLGNSEDLSYKVKCGLQIIEGGSIKETEYGVLDLSLSKVENKTYYSQDYSATSENSKAESSQDENSTGDLTEESSAESSN